MAPTRIQKKRIGSEYGSRILEIYIQGRRRPFRVHKDSVQSRSSFLTKFNPVRQQMTIRNGASTPLTEGDDVKTESEVTFVEDLKPDQQTLEPSENTFDLTSTKVRADDFTIFVDYIYGKDLGPITNLRQAQIAINAYVFAVEMSCTPLQNALVDRMREYHKEAMFDLKLLLLLVGRNTDYACGMASYLISQFAHDLLTDGYEEPSQERMFLDDGVMDGHRTLRGEIFRAVVDLARSAVQPKKIKDPATGECKCDLTRLALQEKKIEDPARRMASAECKWHVHPDGLKCIVLD